LVFKFINTIFIDISQTKLPMNALIIEPSLKTPKVVLDPETGEFEISGKAIPEHISKLRDPIMEWFDSNAGTVKGEAVFRIKLEYFNSSFAVLISYILRKIEKMQKDGADVKIKWFYEADDEDLHESGQEYASMTTVPVELVEVAVGPDEADEDFF
jgi:hypothetical protein